MTGHPFGDEVVRAVRNHMNDDHAEACRTIVRGLGGAPDAIRAEVADVDASGLLFTVATPAGSRQVRVRWSAPVTTRASIREEVVRMHAEARTRLAGAEPDAARRRPTGP